MLFPISEILRDSNYKLTQFTNEKIEKLEEGIFVKESRGKSVPYQKCVVRNKDVRLTPEEVVRQLYAMVLIEDFGYPVDRIEMEYSVS
ncbi:MAG: type I restriction enzyme HsdR N-terminal domain-containing protein, partial [Balneolaceae bacterium]